MEITIIYPDKRFMSLKPELQIKFKLKKPEHAQIIHDLWYGYKEFKSGHRSYSNMRGVITLVLPLETPFEPLVKKLFELRVAD